MSLSRLFAETELLVLYISGAQKNTHPSTCLRADSHTYTLYRLFEALCNNIGSSQ